MRFLSPALALVIGLVSASFRIEAAVTDPVPLPLPLPLPLPPEWSLVTLPGAHSGVALSVLKRTALVPPVRYRVVVVPGSGCTGWTPVAARYFAGLLHAELLVLHKPGVNINAGLAADCPRDFVAHDTLSTWRDHAQAALQAHFTPPLTSHMVSPGLPVLLVGISEGAELLPTLADSVPGLAGVVMLSAPGLDPREAGELQARRLEQGAAWQILHDAQASGARDEHWVEGRTLAYWRDFWHWPLAQPLLAAPWPLLRVWGDADESVPVAAYQRFGQLAQTRSAAFCDLRLPGANHGLQSQPPDQHDGVQWLWSRLEAWARRPAPGLCASVRQ